jgi:UDP-N-acetylglucosamine:LPS N-acetylglucosamine transferase
MTADALILSGSIGSGHDSVARACRDALARDERHAEVLDCMSLLGTVQAKVAAVAFRNLLRAAPLYDAFHFSALRAGSWIARRSAAKATGNLARAIGPHLASPELGALIAVFATGAGVVGWAAKRRPGLGAFVVVTDATAHSIWVQPGVQRYIVFSEMAAGSVRQYDPRADVVVIDAPVRPEFLNPPDPVEARRAVGITGSGPVVLVMGGGWGQGPLLSVATLLAERGCTVIVLAGANRGLLRRNRRPPDGSALRVLAHSDDVATLMAAADVVVTSPGQACHEARAVGRPLVVMDTVPGHGRENLLGELVAGGALATTARPDAIANAVWAALDGRVGLPVLGAPPAPDAWAKQFLGAISWP